ncbi:L,D-transpeptidase family protein (plasmid) [Aureimonas ureilytica]|uniref:L,D-transpeptidase family protein n=1 Tax=Aureimonas ureilytica TaxID=401562 RepID=UPI003CEECD78
MKIYLPVVTALVLASGGALAAPAQPDLSEAAINAATFSDWRTRQDEAARDTQEDGKAAAAGAKETISADGEAQKQQPSEDNDAARAEDRSDTSSDQTDEAIRSDSEDADTPADPFLVRLQVLLDRAHASPGVIDGRAGGNTDKAIRAFEEMRGLKADGAVDEELWSALASDEAPVVRSYTLTQEDVDGRYVKDLPSDYGALAKLDWIGYRGPEEMLAERFHMDEDFLRELNPGADFSKAGTQILVTDPGAEPETKVARIVISKSRGELFAYDENDKVVIAAPATIGSGDTPSPSGTMKVNGSAQEPTYEYDPDKNFQQGKNKKELTLPPGPNGPVGIVWIDLAKPTYGIHGTPEPSEIGKTASHGCVRLTNWDARALSKLILPARTVVRFEK